MTNFYAVALHILIIWVSGLQMMRQPHLNILILLIILSQGFILTIIKIVLCIKARCEEWEFFFANQSIKIKITGSFTSLHAT